MNAESFMTDTGRDSLRKGGSGGGRRGERAGRAGRGQRKQVRRQGQRNIPGKCEGGENTTVRNTFRQCQLDVVCIANWVLLKK